MTCSKLVLDRSALVAYGSETGNAYDYAEELGRMLERIHFRTTVSSLDAVSSLNQYTIVAIVTSTTGQGDLPNNSRNFWKSLLHRKLPFNYLDNVSFTTFGLGDSSYPKFNHAARKLHKRILQLGADEIYPRGEADEQHDEGLDGSFVPWSIDLRTNLLTKLPLPQGLVPIPDSELLQPKWLLGLHSESTNGTEHTIDTGHLQVSRFLPGVGDSIHDTRLSEEASVNLSSDPTAREIPVTLHENTRVTPDSHWQDVRHLVFNSDKPASYNPGDVLTIFPKNYREDVDQFIRQMGWTEVADKSIDFISNTPHETAGPYLPPPLARAALPTTLRSLLTQHLDFTAIPRRSFFSLIAHFTNDDFHKDRLLEFTKPEYIDELYDYTTRPRRSIMEVLQEFESVKIPWQWAAVVLPELRGRQFSIASGGELKTSLQGTARFELLVAIVKYKTVIKKIRVGVCTQYLANLPIGTNLHVTLQKGGLNITKKEAHRRVVMIGPGTGIAPMRSLIWERLQWSQDKTLRGEVDQSQAQNVPAIGHNLLFFGCRNRNADFFYSEEWEKIGGLMPLDVHSAFSRDQANKVYVQDVIRQNPYAIVRALYQSNGIIYVCGSSGKMPRDVRVAVVDALIQATNMDEAEAEDYLQGMEKDGRYKQETW